MAVYAVIDSGKVSNVIVADQDFADLIAPDHGAVVLQIGSAGIGHSYANGVYVSQPIGGNVSVGSDFTLNVVVNADGGVTYQWSKDDVDIPGATSDSYVISSATLSDAGSYKCTVTGAGVVVTDAAVVTVS